MPRKTNFTANGKNYFRVTATIGKDVDGKPIRKQFYGDSQKDAKDKRDEYMSSINKGLSANFDKALFKHVFKTWLENVIKPSVALSSYDRYQTIYKLRIKDSILSNMKLADIKAINMQGYYNALLEKNSVKTVRSTHKLLTNFFNYCVRSELIVKSPLVAVELPTDKDKQSNDNVLSHADIEKMIAAAKDNSRYFIFVFAIFTGLRQGELLALTHNDIDFENNCIHVNKTVYGLAIDGKQQHILSNTKTSGSVRDIPILSTIKPLLKVHIRREIEKHLKLGVPFSGDKVLFSSPTCEYRDASGVRHLLRELYKRLDIKETTFHGLRHTFCTILAEMGIPLKTASVLMGHSNINITAKIYTHVDDRELKKGIEKLAAFFD